MEFTLTTVTMGDRLWTMLNRLETLAEQHRQQIAHEQESGIRQEDTNVFALRHLNISIPDVVDDSILQRDVNLDVTRDQCVLISGPSGCGKTSLFRICAGLQPVDAKQITLPKRRHLLFIPQRPYLPLGSLRFQALFLLEEQNDISDRDISQLFQSVNLQYLLERHALNAIVDWPMVLSVGEQQRLAFVRLLALFTLGANKDQLRRETLVLFDESTSAIDAKTEHDIYVYLSQLGIWFITISHRSTLVAFHARTLQFSSDKSQRLEVELENTDHQVSITDDNENDSAPQEEDENTKAAVTNTKTNSHGNIPGTDERNPFEWKLILNILKFLHLPFQSADNKLKVETIIAWILTLVVLGLGNWCLYVFTEQSGALFSVLSSFSSGSSSLAEAKELIKSNIAIYIVIVVATTVLYALSIGGGRVLATLYTRRQVVYLARLLLDSPVEQYENNLLYHSRDMSVIPNFLSNEIAELNTEFFNFLIGHIYHIGIISQIILAIALSILLGKQDGGSTALLVVYLVIFGFILLIVLLSVLFNTWNTRDEVCFAQFVTAHKRVDFQAEQIAFSGVDVCKTEQNELRQALDASIRSQIHAGFFFSIIVGLAKMCMNGASLVSYGVPAAVFFHMRYSQGVADPTTANTFLTLSLYISNLSSYVYFIAYLGNSITRIASIGTRVVSYLEKLRQINMHHRRLAMEEKVRGRRVFSEPKSDSPCLVLEQVDVQIPHSRNVLISNVNLTLSPSDNLIITGPSGCGKSTLLRLLAGLIPNVTDNDSAVLRILPRQNIIFLSQQLHLIRGTLREQLSYLREAHGFDSVTDDARARQLLHELSLGHLLDRYSMDGERHVWSNLLSIGEQQRLMMVSAFLVGTETVKFFVLDETTSGCDKQTEKAVYEYLQRSHVQFISVSHRKAISKYHSIKMLIDTRHGPVVVPLQK